MHNSVTEVNKNNNKVFVITIIAISTFLIGAVLGSFLMFISLRDTNRVGSEVVLDVSNSQFDIQKEVLGKINEKYIEKDVNQTDLVYGSVRGMVAALDDRYTVFLEPTDNETQQNRNASKFTGIGVTLRYSEEFGYTYVESAIDGFPAQQNGVMAGDLITEVDGKDMFQNRAGQVAENVLGEVDTNVVITFFRPSINDSIEKTITRAEIDLPNIEFIELENGVAQIKVYKFTEATLSEFINQWDDVVDQVASNSSIDKVVLDLRGNPGGFVVAAVHVAEEFLSKDMVIFSEVDREGEEFNVYSSRDGKLKDKKVVILVNGGSTSASEIVAGALQDYQIADLVGTSTGGKGVEQEVINFDDGSALHLVFKKWLTPNGFNVTPEEALTPNHIIEIEEEDIQNGIDPQLDKAIELLSL